MTWKELASIAACFLLGSASALWSIARRQRRIEANKFDLADKAREARTGRILGAGSKFGQR